MVTEWREVYGVITIVLDDLRNAAAGHAVRVQPRMVRLQTCLPAVFLWCAAALVQAAAPSAPVVGEPLRQAIERYASLNVFSSTRLLPRRLTVQALPELDASPRTQIRQLLEPHGLTLVMTDHRSGYVAEREPLGDAQLPPNPAAVRKSDVQPYIEEVVVYAPYRVERTARRQSLHRRQLELIPSAGGDTLRALRILPGVDADGLSASHRIRGGDTNEVLYRLDGVELYKPFHFADAHSLFSAVNPGVVDSVDVYVSGFPSRFGTRMSGVVDLHLVEPERPVQGTVDLSAMAVAADARGYSGNWSWLASGRVSLVGDVLDLLNIQGEENLAVPRFDDELARLRWSDADDELVFGALRTGETVDVEQERAGERAGADVDHHDLWVRWRRDFDADLQSVWQASRFSAERTRSGTTEQGEDATGQLSERRSSRISTLANRWRWTPRREVEVNAGWAHLWHHAEFEASLDVLYGPVGLPVQGKPRETRDLAFHRSGTSTYAFASVTRTLAPQLTGTVGARYDKQDVADVDSAEWSGRLALSYQASPAWQLDLDAGRYKQPQLLHEIQIDEGRTELDPPQHADQVNLGVGWTPTSRLTFRADLYARRIGSPWARFESLYDRFVLLPELGGDRYLIEASESRARGIEVTASYGGTRLNWQLAYARTASQERVAERWHDRSWDQPHGVKAHIAWTGDKWRVSFAAAWRSGWPVTPLVTLSSGLPRRLNAARLPDYFSFDAHAARVFATRRGRLEVYAEVKNVTNRRNVIGHRYDPEFLRTESLSLPVVPSVGVRWTW